MFNVNVITDQRKRSTKDSCEKDSWILRNQNENRKKKLRKNLFQILIV